MGVVSVAVILLQAASVVWLAPLVAGLAARGKAWTESRRGPPVLQPYRDLAKYLRKEMLVPEGASRLFVAAPFLAFGAYGVISVILPILTPYPLPTAPIADFLGGGLLFGLAGALTALAALDASSQYPALGASRSIGFAAFAEPTLIVVFFGVAALTGTDNPYTTNRLLAGSAAAYLAPAHLLLLAAFFLLVLFETGKLPVESSGLNELSMVEEGRIFEHSGPLLGLWRWNGWMKQFLLYSVLLNVFAAPWGLLTAPTLGAAGLDLALLLAKMLLLVGLLVLLEATLAKVRLFKIRDFLALSFALALLGFLAFALLGGS